MAIPFGADAATALCGVNTGAARLSAQQATINIFNQYYSKKIAKGKDFYLLKIYFSL
ncbi:MAG TPA: hypothetical protein H9729_07295 [Candidatus Borkfalkia excrementigallinarum]|uniref:Uncharacterized protein n=1 Tax=Candidatus Borkfalkia excrementigallinarum TaxID=2838506 RepID=A0A9D1ZVZ0_9FIRM|nr:hypothetical protein [Candidatus Borkfalkia excrementigallinarum]